jgi:hypothetical protein
LEKCKTHCITKGRKERNFFTRRLDGQRHAWEMHWSNLTASIVTLCGQMNLMTRRRSPSNKRGRTKRKSFSVWFAM